MSKFQEMGAEVGQMVDEKNSNYGNSFGKTAEFLILLYPDGIRVDQYADLLCLLRIFDKQMRIATSKKAYGESPYTDIIGYGMLGLHMDQSDGPKAEAVSVPPAPPEKYDPPESKQSFRNGPNEKDAPFVPANCWNGSYQELFVRIKRDALNSPNYDPDSWSRFQRHLEEMWAGYDAKTFPPLPSCS